MKQKNRSTSAIRDVQRTINSGNIIWVWLENGDQFMPYNHTINQLIETAFNAKLNSIIFDTSGAKYEINFAALVQINLSTKAIRSIRRIPINPLNSAMPSFTWEWYNDNNNFVQYSVTDANIIENAYKSMQFKLNLTINNTNYSIDLQTMTQINTKTNMKRNIRRNPPAVIPQSSTIPPPVIQPYPIYPQADRKSVV